MKTAKHTVETLRKVSDEAMLPKKPVPHPQFTRRINDAHRGAVKAFQKADK